MIIFVCILFFLSLLLAAVIDYFTLIIPDSCVVTASISGLIFSVWKGTAWKNAGWAVCFLCFSMFILIFDQGKNIGGGDLKLLFASILCLGMIETILALMIGCIFALFCEGLLFLFGKGRRIFPMGPYLAAGILYVFVAFVT